MVTWQKQSSSLLQGHLRNLRLTEKKNLLSTKESLTIKNKTEQKLEIYSPIFIMTNVDCPNTVLNALLILSFFMTTLCVCISQLLLHDQPFQNFSLKWLTFIISQILWVTWAVLLVRADLVIPCSTNTHLSRSDGHLARLPKGDPIHQSGSQLNVSQGD